MVPPRIPYWRLSSFYFYFFGLLGALLPFWGLYLREQGFSLGQIGQLMAILVGTKLVAPNAWGWLADHTGHRLTAIRFGGACSLDWPPMPMLLSCVRVCVRPGGRDRSERRRCRRPPLFP